MKSVRAFRGATQLEADDAAEMREAVSQLLESIIEANGLKDEDLISILLT
ncbi:MAG: chorismate mutase, partial [Actinobacteria bacterium]|nr:chorismate mutase [Actinomycetota bacterium]